MNRENKYTLGYAICNSIQENKDKIEKLEKQNTRLKKKNKQLKEEKEELKKWLKEQKQFIDDIPTFSNDIKNNHIGMVGAYQNTLEKIKELEERR